MMTSRYCCYMIPLDRYSMNIIFIGRYYLDHMLRDVLLKKGDVDIFVDSGLIGLSFFGLLEDVVTKLNKSVDLIDKSQVIPGSTVDSEIKATGIVIYEL